jgi:PKHD-type hydroxylase
MIPATQPNIFVSNNIIIAENVIPEQRCNAIVEYMKRYNSTKTTSGGVGGLEEKEIKKLEDIPDFKVDEDGIPTNTNVRSCEVSWIFSTDKFTSEVIQQCNDIMTQINFNYYGFDVWRPEPIQYTHYTFHEDAEIKDHYDWHVDSSILARNTPFDRKLSMSLQLSRDDAYTGCNLEFPDHVKFMQANKRNAGVNTKTGEPITNKDLALIIRQQGTAILFPSFAHHRVTPIESGERYCLVNWMQGPRFR